MQIPSSGGRAVLEQLAKPSDPLLGLVHRLLPFHDNREIIEISTA
jgi:hypothetical protein